LYYTASGIVTPVGGRPVRRLGETSNIRKRLVYCNQYCNFGKAQAVAL